MVINNNVDLECRIFWLLGNILWWKETGAKLSSTAILWLDGLVDFVMPKTCYNIILCPVTFLKLWGSEKIE